ncbi:MAG: hypothetical protein KU37_10250 [Sulfuricurvum sp. PC08-66]|nr:MAG: hypothetical protein KU37_10250 [Sulfuricurvum sp. PC08-66]
MSFILLLLVAGIFYWLFVSSGKGQFVKIHPTVSFEEVLHSEYGYIMALVAKLSKSDGSISALEQAFIASILDDLAGAFRNPEEALGHLKDIFDEEQDIEDNVAFVAQHLYETIRSESRKAPKILEFLVNLAYIDGVLHPKERQILEIIAQELRLEKSLLSRYMEEFANLYAQQRAQRNSNAMSIEAAYALLGVESNVDATTLKSAYRKQVKLHHPDIVSGKGGTHEDIQAATKKLQEINEAYELIQKAKGF